MHGFSIFPKRKSEEGLQRRNHGHVRVMSISILFFLSRWTIYLMPRPQKYNLVVLFSSLSRHTNSSHLFRYVLFANRVRSQFLKQVFPGFMLARILSASDLPPSLFCT